MNNAGLYQESNQQQKRDALLFLKKYASKIKWGKDSNRIIDIGCGDGSVTNILKEHIPVGYQYNVLGIDISDKMIQYANEHHQDQKTTFKILNIASDLVSDLEGNFDHVFSFYALHWITDQKYVFSNIYNLLDAGGDCFLIFVAGAQLYDVYRILQQKKKWSSLVTDLERYISPYHDVQEPDKELRQIMKNIGFINIEVEHKDKSFVYENTDMAKKALQSIYPINIPDDVCVEFMAHHMEAAKEYGFMYSPGEGQPETVKMHYRLLIAYAQKPDHTVEDTKL